MTINIFLDDVRVPSDCSYTADLRYTAESWRVYRSFDEFLNLVSKYYIDTGALPSLISFDHDLFDEHYKYLVNPIPYHLFVERTGYHAALWLKKLCDDNELDYPEVLCHSMNPAGKENIMKLFYPDWSI